ncbi:MAG: hypothetical protein WBC20_05360 [Candidatus Aminicenantaceae bacterium]
MGQRVVIILSVAFLAACLFFPTLHFLGKLKIQLFKTLFFLASLGWFICASLWFWIPRKLRDKKK